jgi:hypothetical protein
MIVVKLTSTEIGPIRAKLREHGMKVCEVVAIEDDPEEPRSERMNHLLQYLVDEKRSKRKASGIKKYTSIFYLNAWRDFDRSQLDGLFGEKGKCEQIIGACKASLDSL